MTSGYTVEQSVIFAEKDGYRPIELDVHRIAGSSEPLPLLLNVHGGGWRVSSRQRAPRETRSWTPSFFERLAAAGFVVASSDYRFSAEALYPAAIEDTVDALQFLRANAERFGIDPERAVVFGQSGGGYLAAAVGLHQAIEPVRGVVCWYPLTDFSRLDPTDAAAATYPAQFLGAPLGEVPELVEASALTRLAHADAPPFLLHHGTADTMAPYDQSVALRDALAAAGASVELDSVDGAEHFFEGAGAARVEDIFRRTIDFARRCVA